MARQAWTILAPGLSARLNPVMCPFQAVNLPETLVLMTALVAHRRLLQAVWGPDYGEETESLRVVINQLRKKLEADPARPKYIVTEPWVGYRFQPPRASNARSSARKA